MKPFSSLELSSFCGQIALILKAGISSLEGLMIMQEDAASSGEKEVLLALLSNMQDTGCGDGVIAEPLCAGGLDPQKYPQFHHLPDDHGRHDDAGHRCSAGKGDAGL